MPQNYAHTHDIELKTAYKKVLDQFAEHAGTLNWYCVDFWSEQLQLDIEQLKHDIQDKIAYRPQVAEFLAALRQAGKRSVIITNAHPKSVALKMVHTNLAEQVDRLISSHTFNRPKEHAEFWLALAETEPFDCASTLLIDDSLAVLRSARRHGIAHLLSIAQPDSQRPRLEHDEFTALDQFDDINPLLSA